MYKDKTKQKEANKEASQRQRDKTKGMTPEGMTGQGMTLLKRPNMMGDDGPLWKDNDYDPNELWEGQLRYVGPFSDRQVLDRATVMS